MKGMAITLLFNAPLSSGCDYVLQTAKIISSNNPTYGIALGDIISLPKLLFSRDRWIMRRIHNAMIIRPVSLFPGVQFRPVRMLAYYFYSSLLRAFVHWKHRQRRNVVWFFEPFHISLLLPIFRRDISIYDCVDYYPGFNEEAHAEHRICMDSASLIFANSKPLAHALRKVRPDTITVPLGVATDMFMNQMTQIHPKMKRKPTVGFIGGISDRIDFHLLTKIVQKLKDVQFEFIGPPEPGVFGKPDAAIKSMNALTRYKNVRWIPGIPKKDIPKAVSRFDMGLIPYREDLPFNTYSFPMKVMEYFLRGIPVISTDIIALREYSKKHLLYIASTPESTVRAIKHIQRHGWLEQKRRLQYSTSDAMSWQRKVDTIVRIISRYSKQ